MFFRAGLGCILVWAFLGRGLNTGPWSGTRFRPLIFVNKAKPPPRVANVDTYFVIDCFYILWRFLLPTSSCLILLFVEQQRTILLVPLPPPLPALAPVSILIFWLWYLYTHIYTCTYYPSFYFILTFLFIIFSAGDKQNKPLSPFSSCPSGTRRKPARGGDANGGWWAFV